ncbi:MAG TPA: hypothetical protein VI685_12385 [Candidatus Angelobacter sp.]
MAQDLTEKILKLIPKSTSTILSAMFFVATLLVNYGASRTHISDVQAQQEKRLDSIEAQIKNDLATRREVDEVKSTVNRIEDKLDKVIGVSGHRYSGASERQRSER